MTGRFCFVDSPHLRIYVVGSYLIMKAGVIFSVGSHNLPANTTLADFQEKNGKAYLNCSHNLVIGAIGTLWTAMIGHGCCESNHNSAINVIGQS